MKPLRNTFVLLAGQPRRAHQLPIHKAQLLSYMKLLNVPLGLLINFHEMKVTDGISRLILPGANQ
jgi:hypothetical protein